VNAAQLITNRLRDVIHSTGIITRTVTNRQPDWATNRGWMVPALVVDPSVAEYGERVLQEMSLRNGRLSLTLINPTGNTGENWLLMLDEIQTGMGRTGKWFSFQHAGILPDVMTLAKALGNGMPIGACVAAGKAANVLQPGSHGTTFGGNPLACAAALAVIKAIEDTKLVVQAEKQGSRILKGLKDSLGSVKGVSDIRGQGLLIGVELDRPCRELMIKGLEHGIVLNVTADTVIRLLPPLIISDEECDMVIDKVGQLVRDFLATP